VATGIQSQAKDRPRRNLDSPPIRSGEAWQGDGGIPARQIGSGDISRLTDLIAQVEESNPALAGDLRREVAVLSARRPFGLNFERHQPETVQLPERKIRPGDKVAVRPERGDVDPQPDRRTWIVTGFKGKGPDREAELVLRGGPELHSASHPVSELVVVAEFRDPIYPGLRSTGTIVRGEDRPHHVVVNGENYHVLEALAFAYEGQVDCIYMTESRTREAVRECDGAAEAYRLAGQEYR
jgi:adenine-specific DNA-methyltransferase